MPPTGTHDPVGLRRRQPVPGLTGSQYPALKVDFDGDGTVDDWTEFGYQVREALGLTATGSEARIDLSWSHREP